MESRRFFLFCALGVISFLIYQAWQTDFATVPQAQLSTAAPLTEDGRPARADGASSPASNASTASAANSAADLPVGETDSDGLPDIRTAAPAAGAIGTTGDSANADGSASADADRFITVVTDRMKVRIDRRGGVISEVELLGYAVSKDQPKNNLKLVNDRMPYFFVIQSGLVAENGTSASHKTLFETAGGRQRDYRLAEGIDEIEVPLSWTAPDGHQVLKRFRFSRDSYIVDLDHVVENRGSSATTLSPYVRMWRTATTSSEDPPFIQSFMGVGLYEQKEGKDSYRFKKYPFDDIEEEPLQRAQSGGWISLMQHYFAVAVLPPEDQANSFFARKSKKHGYLAEYLGPREVVEPGAETQFSTRLFIGPKLQDRLADIAPGLELTVDYGLLTGLSEPLFWVLQKFYNLTGNWGWAIVLLTVMIKLTFYKLSEAQYRSMARMRKFAPRMQTIKERYADDREGMQKAMMDLYKKEKFNPFAGCWPMLVQFPVFIALYWVLLESVELRQVPFILWLNDLSSPDPFYILPIAFGATMWFQQKLSGSNMTMDPTQQKIMQVMPVMLSVFFAFFPVGLVLYWLVSNLIGIAQQWYIYRKLENEGLGKKS